MVRFPLEISRSKTILLDKKLVKKLFFRPPMPAELRFIIFFRVRTAGKIQRLILVRAYLRKFQSEVTRLYVLVMPRTRFRVNPHSIVA